MTLIQSLFHILRYYYVESDVENCKTYLDIIKDELKTDKDIFNNLTRHEITHLKYMAKSILNDNPIYNIILDKINTYEKSLSVSLDRVINEEKDLKYFIANNESIIKKLLCDDNVRLYGIEYNTKYGDCDLLFRNSNSMIVCELKYDRVDHKIVGQCLKYAGYFIQKTIYRQWEYVYMITIGLKYDDYSLLQLKNCNVLTIVYSISDNVMKFDVV